MSRITLVTTVIATALILPHDSARASGTTINEVSARASGMQGAFTAIADDPSAIFYNPAGITQLEGTQIAFNPSIVVPNIEYERPGLGSVEDQGSIPGFSLFATSDVLGSATLGLGLYVPFGRATKFDNNATLLGLSHRASLIRTDLTPTIAFRPHPNVSVGLGLVASHVSLYTNILGLEESARGYGFTANAGVLIEGPEHLSFGLSYRGAMASRLEGHGTFAGQRDDFHAKLRFPAIMSAGLAWEPNEKLLLSATWDWEMWSYVEDFRRDYTNATLGAVGTNNFDADDVGTLRIGAVYRPKPEHEIRLGFSRSPSAFPARNTAPAQPDLDLQFFSVGYSRILDKLTLSLSYQFVQSKERTTQSPFFPGRYEIRADILQVGFSYRWDAD